MQLLDRKIVRVLLFSFIGFCLLLVGVYIYTSNQNPYGDQLTIANLDKYTSGKPSNPDTLKYIQSNLYRVVNLNTNPSVKSDSVKDITVREKSFSQTYSVSTHVHTILFVVDIKSLKQSYNIKYQWVEDSVYGPNKAEYGTQVSCLAIDELIYGNFNCVDDRILEKGKERYNYIEKVLPYTVQYKYSIKSYKNILGTDKVTLTVEAFVPSWADKQAILDSYSEEIKEWIKSKKLDPNNYFFDYVY
jgi:hypothetical protein